MLEMLSPAKPELGGLGAAVRLSDVLDAAVASMNKKSITDPDVEAEMRRFIGRAYATMGEADKALVQFKRDAGPGLVLGVAPTCSCRASYAE